MSSNRRFNRARRKSLIESLESRRLLAANIHMVGVSIIDQNFNPDPNPTVGSTVYLKIVFTTTGLAANATYDVSPTFNGVNFSYNINWGAGNSGPDTWEFDFFDTVARSGPTSASATLDSQNTVAESNEADNSGTVSYTPVQLPITGKMAQPIGAVAERNYSYTNYIDQDPSSPGYADYRGGLDTYDGHDGIDMTVPSFAYMDSGTPIIATLSGTVVYAQDGFYDRNTSGSFDAGNFVEIDSGNGYQEYYYHLREGSVGVQVGQTVQQGQVIGLMGASGNAFGAHLHFGLYNGGPVEPFRDPFTYWQNPAPYQGDVDAVTDSGVTNYDPNPILNAYERPPDYKNYKQQSGQTVYSWFICDTAANEPAAITYYRPNGTAYSTTTYTTSNNAGGYNYTQATLPTTPDLGTWQVAFTVNGEELARNSFTVSTTGAAGARVDQGGTFIANNRETPIDRGTFSQGSTATALSFTVTNYGNASMTLGTPTLPPGWVLTDPLVASLAAGASDTLGVKLDTSTLGYRYGFLAFTTSDPNIPTYSFALGGTVNPTAATPAVAIYTRDSAASETGMQPGIFRVTRTGDTTNALVVNLSISGSATNGTDYSTIANTVTIPAGQSTASVIVTPNDDASAESSENVIVSLASSASYTIGLSNSATVTITDNDTVSTASISGNVYLDQNFNTYKDTGEGGVSGITLFLDTNSNGVFDTGEPQATTDVNGNYAFTSLPAGRYNLRSMSSSYVISTPLGQYSVASGQTLTVNLGAFPISFTGTNGNDTFSVAAAPTSNRVLITAGGVMYNALRSQLPSLLFTGSGGNDTITIDATMLSHPPGLFSVVPITFSGDAGTDTLTLTNTDATENLNLQSNQLSIAATNITLSGTESIVLDGTSNSAIQLNSLSVSSGTVSLAAGKHLVLKLATISLTGSGSLNLTDNAMIVTATGVSNVRSLLASGYAAGAWTGTGIFSSTAASAAGAALGVAQASDIGSPASFAGQAITGNPVLVRYTVAGDANLDQVVNVADLSAIAKNYNQTGKVYSQGDFNYDGAVNVADLQILVKNWNKTTSSGSMGPLLPLETILAMASLPSSALLPPPPPPPPLSTISGSVFNDLNRDKKRGKHEQGLAGWRVFIDSNNKGVLDDGEKSVLTDAKGNWKITGLTAGTYTVRIMPKGHWSGTTPKGGAIKVKLGSGVTVAGELFGQAHKA